MITTEEKLQLLITKIEGSSLSIEDRSLIYAKIRDGFRSAIFPVIVKNLSQEELQKLHRDLDHVTPQKFLSLISSAFSTKQIYKDMDELLLKIIYNYEKLLKEERVI